MGAAKMAEKVFILRKEEFFMEVERKITERLGENYEVKLQEVRKNNNVHWQGLIIQEKGRSLAPTVYLDHLYQEYENGMEMEEILESIQMVLREKMPMEDVDMKFFLEYELVKDRICYRLINEERNRELLSEIPHIPFLDLAICFIYSFESGEMGNGSILVRNQYMETWGVSVKELWETANRNTSALFLPECTSMENILQEMGVTERTEFHSELPEKDGKFLAMSVLSNRQRIFGSAVILYDDYLKRIGEWLGKNYFILPSSIHEVILLPESGDEDYGDMRAMIQEINETQVEDQEVLSDNLYYFDCEKKNLRII